ncbi:26S proteasome non-ATPase regulatory subunit 9 isoform X2 [Ananas comosus]|uniref:26S proteasome non-ATPase regulatory subunit 9 isoform X2 n=1 Tax=Ananas comosus TaxID=4615 RepID=A0A6P5EJ40_ANACO|nr:26S proteasome non-ATPase regulatory subunit 9 isoform X2 [Ananas comosus]
MVGANVKAETLSLMERRAAMEADMNAIIDALSRPGGPGISGNLLDSQGFPRPDIDIPTVRAQRHRLAGASASHGVSSQYSPVEEDPIVRIPFAIIDEIVDDSPAAEDGLQLGDEIVKFGSVEIGDGLQAKLVSEAQSNQGRTVPLIIIRHGSVMNLNVIPRQWRGRGLLGCHFRIL